MDIDLTLQNENDTEDILEMSFDADDDRETFKTLYELFHVEVGNIPLLTSAEEKELSRRIREENDDEAFQRFVLANLRLVIACAKKVKDRMGHQSILSFMDLVQEGILGLMVAVRRFDYKRNTRFSTYGIPWIYQRIRIAMVQHRHGFCVPGYAGTSVHTMSKQIQAFKEGKLDSLPPDADMERLKVLTRISGSTVPIDYPDDSSAGTFSLNPEKIYAGAVNGGDLDDSLFTPANEGHLFRQEALEVLSRNLSDREYDILCRRFGLGGYGCQTLADIASVYGKSTEHIRSVINKCMGKLKENRELRDFCSSWEIV